MANYEGVPGQNPHLGSLKEELMQLISQESFHGVFDRVVRVLRFNRLVDLFIRDNDFAMVYPRMRLSKIKKWDDSSGKGMLLEFQDTLGMYPPDIDGSPFSVRRVFKWGPGELKSSDDVWPRYWQRKDRVGICRANLRGGLAEAGSAQLSDWVVLTEWTRDSVYHTAMSFGPLIDEDQLEVPTGETVP